MSARVDVTTLNDDELRRLIEERFGARAGDSGLLQERLAGVSREMTARFRGLLPAEPLAAAVLMPIVERETGLTMLLTQRASHLRNHAGQVSFPGGRIEPDDPGPIEAALRETEEEIGLARRFVRPIGRLEDHLVISGFSVAPIIALVTPGFDLELDAREVDLTFEVPLRHLLDAANHRAGERTFGDVTVTVYDIPFEGHHIWGATAGMLITFYRRMVGLED
jgi:8-oxo-dGTP pyrophosphatase MutT (NUDIX family)